MRENKYDDPRFFDQYSRMERSVKGLEGAGEWHALRELLPDFRGKRVLDLGCGFGWHCRYAAEQGAARVVGVDLSENMLARAREMTDSPNVEYIRTSIEDIDFSAEVFDAVISSLAFHYVSDIAGVYRRVAGLLVPGGAFVFSCEHPVFTAMEPQGWICDQAGTKLHWPVDGYFDQGLRKTVFLGEAVIKHHRTVTGYVMPLLEAGFVLDALVEPQPADPAAMPDELRRPMMLILAAHKQ